jgi:hypothetical protein
MPLYHSSLAALVHMPPLPSKNILREINIKDPLLYAQALGKWLADADKL